MRSLFRDPDNPTRTSRAKVTAAATALVSALLVALRMFGVEMEIPRDVLISAAVGLLSLTQYFIRDRRTAREPRIGSRR